MSPLILKRDLGSLIYSIVMCRKSVGVKTSAVCGSKSTLNTTGTSECRVPMI